MNREDVLSPQGISVYAWIASGSFFLTFVVFYVISPAFSLRHFSSYNELPVNKKIDWDTRLGSNIHAVIVSTLALFCLFFDTATSANPVWNEDAVLIRCGISITMGYISADFVILLICYQHVGDTFMAIHHLMAMTAYYFVVVSGVLPYFANFRQLAEISTVFVNQRWLFDASGWPRSSRAFVVNGWSMVVTFFLSRVAVMPWYYYKCYSVLGSVEQQQLGVMINFFWIFTCLVLDFLNVVWFGKMVRGALKLTTSLKTNGVTDPKDK